MLKWFIHRCVFIVFTSNKADGQYNTYSLICEHTRVIFVGSISAAVDSSLFLESTVVTSLHVGRGCGAMAERSLINWADPMVGCSVLSSCSISSRARSRISPGKDVIRAISMPGSANRAMTGKHLYNVAMSSPTSACARDRIATTVCHSSLGKVKRFLSNTSVRSHSLTHSCSPNLH